MFVLSHLLRAWTLVFLVAQPALLRAEEARKPYSPHVEPASEAAQQAISGFRIPQGMKLELVAAEPLLANPVAFTFDEQGRIYIAETFRQGKGVEDNRGHMNWLDDDLAAQTVDDRLAYFRKHQKDKVTEYAIEHDRIRLLFDRNGDGTMDDSTIFADGFNGIVEGTGSGLLVRGGNVYYACIPNLWTLRDDDHDFIADHRSVLHTGYGVRVAFRGHDLHGLCWGPDGKLYYSVGDRGMNVTHDGKTLAYPDRGVVLRCNPDGSELEVVAMGLRNPQELAFDEHGNLFTGDNNSDSGDRARWVYVVEGGDSGWRMNYQYLSDRGPWNREKLWHPQWDGQAAYVVPPITNFADGPSGLCFYPGVGLGEKYRGSFFLADFRGTPASSGVRTFKLQPKGASFELIEPQEFVWSILATDCDFGPDGGFYISDWVEGWTGPGKGRIYRMIDPAEKASRLVQETSALIKQGMAGRSDDELSKLLEHPDMRVRQLAQFALAEKGAASAERLINIAKSSSHQLARLHAIWGLGQIGPKQPTVVTPVIELLSDADEEVRCQAAKVLGDARIDAAFEPLVKQLQDESLRARFFAAQSLGKLGRKEAIPKVLAMLRENNNQDVYLRHAGVMALAGCGSPVDLLANANDDSAAARMAVLLALRRHASPEIARFLADTDLQIVEEAARAINDLPIDSAMPALAANISHPGLTDPTLRRVLNAHYRLGKPENATAVSRFAARSEAPEVVRLEAINMLQDWAKPKGRDRVLGSWRPLEPRAENIASDALRAALPAILTGSNSIREQCVQVAGRLGIREVAPMLAELIADPSHAVDGRAEALRALSQLRDSRLTESLRIALADKEPPLRAEALRLLAVTEPAKALEHCGRVLASGAIVEQQAALELLGGFKKGEAEALLSKTMDRLLAGQLPNELHLELLTAAEKNGSPNLQARRAEFYASLPQDDALRDYRVALAGGNADRGQKIFFERAEVSCVRCHKIGKTGGDVGPDLSKVAADKNREYLLESITDPNRQIAKGFDSVTLQLDDGQIISGVLKSDDTMGVRLITPEGKTITIAQDAIEQRAAGKSAMPEDVVTKLSKSDIRDLVEFLTTLH